jgi:hypothetical protein
MCCGRAARRESRRGMAAVYPTRLELLTPACAY